MGGFVYPFTEVTFVRFKGAQPIGFELKAIDEEVIALPFVHEVDDIAQVVCGGSVGGRQSVARGRW